MGEQFALHEAIERLEALPRPIATRVETLTIAAADPLNLVGIITPGPRRSPLSTARIVLEDGVPLRDEVERARQIDQSLTAL